MKTQEFKHPHFINKKDTNSIVFDNSGYDVKEKLDNTTTVLLVGHNFKKSFPLPYKAASDQR